jgi:hypothetical protein
MLMHLPEQIAHMRVIEAHAGDTPFPHVDPSSQDWLSQRAMKPLPSRPTRSVLFMARCPVGYPRSRRWRP